MSDASIVQLCPDQTQVNLPEDERREAINAAFWVTCSVHEHAWTDKQAAQMARYVLWAHQRLSAIEQCVSGGLEHGESD